MTITSTFDSGKVFQGTYLIVECRKRYNNHLMNNGGWYRVFGSGGFWNVLLLDRHAGFSTTTPPYQPGHALVGVRLRPSSEPDDIVRRVAHLETFSLLVPRASYITLAEL